MKFRRLTAAIIATVMVFAMAMPTSGAEAELETETEVTVGTEIDMDLLEEGGVELYDGTRMPLDAVLSHYTDRKFFSNTGSECGCHGWCNWNSDCDCKKYDNSSQCAAFAKYVFYHARGYKWSDGETVNKNVTNVTATSARTALKDTPRGAYVLIVNNIGNEHSLSVLETSDTHITVYDANSRADGRGWCQIRYERMTWEKFAGQCSKIVKVVK